MNAVWKRIACALMSVALLCACCICADAVNEYLQNPRWRGVSGTEATEILENGETFVLYCYREGCGNCRNIGAHVVTEWMDTYGKEIYGANVDASDGMPSWVKTAMGKKRATLPFVAFARDGSVKAFSFEGDYATYTELLNDEFFALYPELTRAQLTIVTPPDKTAYLTDEPLDTSGMTLQAVYPDGSTETVSEGFVCDGFSSAQPGHKTVTVSYNGLKTTFTAAVNTPDGIASIWIEQPARTKLQYGKSAALTVDGCNLPEDVQIEWSCSYKTINGTKRLVGKGAVFALTAKGFTQNVTVTAAARAADGKPILDNSGVAVKTQHIIRFQNNVYYRLVYLLEDVLGWI